MFPRPLKCDRNVKHAMTAIDMFADTARGMMGLWN
jgi:hypothetical protein